MLNGEILRADEGTGRYLRVDDFASGSEVLDRR